ncbi:hypothetical protein [Pajaroellobacter abortibovis]|uniref:Uncharacterized protein n=1 Tax=Pajaroellobacter abortibovis TaxID=1882918 RepID=A0A1L6MXV8_9BACT|nr:hypothetical protein [Pajaroellobacter abortibovis]APS00350.1 hypothetical protein BCY86_06410 [Pajaroellobacter abortibovis]
MLENHGRINPWMVLVFTSLLQTCGGVKESTEVSLESVHFLPSAMVLSNKEKYLQIDFLGGSLNYDLKIMDRGEKPWQAAWLCEFALSGGIRLEDVFLIFLRLVVLRTNF